MLIIPAIDLKQGQCVRLQQGQFDKVSVYEATPQVLAKHYADQGATRLHIVDLDGAEAGNLQQLPLIQSMHDPRLSIQVGGGIRSIGSSTACIDAGIKTLVIGSIAVSSPELTLEIIKLTGAEHIVLAFDVNIEQGTPKPAIHGWKTATKTNLWELVAFYQKAGVTQVLCTDIACDGMMSGPNFNLYEEAVTRFPSIAWQASGGIRHVQDIRQLATTGVASAILGRMLYESDFDLAACIKEFTPC